MTNKIQQYVDFITENTHNLVDLEERQLEEELNEVLSKKAPAGSWIHDFVKSDNPKFKGKSKKERIKMALGAYYSAHPEKSNR